MMQTPSPSPRSRSRVLVTGATGFAGGHLVEALVGTSAVVVGLSRATAWPAELRHLEGRAELRSCDLCDGRTVEAILREVQPERIVHAAGYAQVGRSFHEPEAAWSGNLRATLTLYDAVLGWKGRPRILFIGSGLVYGDPDPPDQPQNERCLLRPTTPYATSKAAADLASYQYAHHPGLDIVIARPFNHIGPRQSSQFAIAHFAKQLAAIGHRKAPPLLETGNLSPQRDLTDVRDMVAAYLLLLERGRTGEAYNIGTGQTRSIQEVLDRLVALAGLKVEVRPRADLVRSTDQAVVRADAGKLRQETGWTPRYSLDQTLADTLAYWRTLTD
jgi:GDP-4-dehydro-6-deoxy-D-mannose reductase